MKTLRSINFIIIKKIAAILLSGLIGCNSPIQYPEGGYAYPKKIAPLDVHQYHYPVKDIVSREDSFENSYMYLFYESYNEPNISLKPQPLETFRLTYYGFSDEAVISASNNVITIKRGVGLIGWNNFNHDDSLLNDVERRHFGFMQWRFPIDTAGKDSSRKQFIRTELKKYPYLLDPFYYKTLFEKSLTTYDEGYFGNDSGYIEKNVAISQNDYRKWVEELNASGYWKLPYRIVGGEDESTDGNGFCLEANIANRYNYVGKRAGNDTSRFDIACQHLLNLAGLENDKRICITDAVKKD